MHKHTLEQAYAEHHGKVSDKWAIYLAEYERLLAEYRDAPVRLLEIGIQNGGSLEIWSKYFRNANKLVGCDINPDCSTLSYDDARIAVVIGDATAAETREAILAHAPSYDIVIDDGSHRSSDIVNTFVQYFQHLEDGGIYIAEDLHCSYWQEFEGGLFDPFSSISFFKRLADLINHEHWGVQKTYSDLLGSFSATYGFGIDEEVLRHIHSVEFINSICVVRKRAPRFNVLGTRHVAGETANVVPVILTFKSESAQSLNQAGNKWSTASAPPEEELPLRMVELADQASRIHELTAHSEQLLQVIAGLESSLESAITDREAKIAALNETIAAKEHHITSLNNVIESKDAQIGNLESIIKAIQTSNIWRATTPLRIAGNQIKRANRILRIAPAAIRHGGGPMNTLGKAVQVYRKEGVSGIKRALTVVRTAGQINPPSGLHAFDRNDYAEWVRRYDTLTDQARDLMHRRIEQFASAPLISIVMPTYNPRPEWLIEAIESVRKQIYPHWELCIADDASTNAAISDILKRYAATDDRIKIVLRKTNGHISAASNSALELATGDWTALLDHDDLLPEHALFWVADAINSHPHAALFYSDEDKLDEGGQRQSPYFKCDWNIDLFHSHNMICHLGTYRTQLLREIGGFRVGLEGAQDYDLALRCIERVEPGQIVHIPHILYHWRIHAESTAQAGAAKPYAAISGERALNEHFRRCGIGASAEYINVGYRIRYAVPAEQPLVSIIIPTRNGLLLIRQCIDSILAKTTYANYEILIVDNGSDEQETLDYFKTLATEPRVRVIRDDRPFNYSALNNAAVKVAKGEFVLLLNNDIEIITPTWLTEMVSHAARSGVGAVGARLFYPNDTLQHGGVILGIGGVAGHSHKYLPRYSNGYFSRARLTQSLSAVTAACLLIRKSIYEEVGGLNEEDLQVAFNDVDFCLRVRDAGYRNVWTAFAECYHHESATRGVEDTPEKQARFAKEVHYMTARWAGALDQDPAYSPCLTLEHEDFSLAWPPRIELM